MLPCMILIALMGTPLSGERDNAPVPPGKDLSGIDVYMEPLTPTDIVVGQDVEFEVTLINTKDRWYQLWLWFTVKLEDQIHEKMVISPYMSKASPFPGRIPPFGEITLRLSARPLDERQVGFYTLRAKIGPKVIPFDSPWVSMRDSFDGNILPNEAEKQSPGSQGDGWVITSFRVVDEGSNSMITGDIRPLSKAVNIVQNHPNPFNPSTAITYEVKPAVDNVQVPVDLMIFDVHGRLVRTLIDERKSTGTYTVNWDGRDERGVMAESGVYLFRLQSGKDVSLKKGLLAK
jgi:hypothetical protein